MSNKALNHIAQLDLKPALAYPLMIIADGVNDFGEGYFSQAYLAWRMGAGERTVRRALAELEEMQLIQRGVTYRRDGSRGRDQSVIRLDMSERAVELYGKTPWREVREAEAARRRSKYDAYREGAPEQEWGDDLPQDVNDKPESESALPARMAAKDIPANLAGRSLAAKMAGSEKPRNHADSDYRPNWPVNGQPVDKSGSTGQIVSDLPAKSASRVKNPLIIPIRSDARDSAEPAGSPSEAGPDGLTDSIDFDRMNELLADATGLSAPEPVLRRAARTVLARCSEPVRHPVRYVVQAIRQDPSLLSARPVERRELAAGTAMCTKPGHEAYPAHNCAGCRTDRLTAQAEARRPGSSAASDRRKAQGAGGSSPLRERIERLAREKNL